jgi:hypothetical protein
LEAILLMAAIIASDGVLREVLVVMSTEGSSQIESNGNLLWDRHFRLGRATSCLGLVWPC